MEGSIISNSNDMLCIRYEQSGMQRDITEREWYIKQLRTFIEYRPHAPVQEAWNWFQDSNITIWAYSWFQKLFNRYLREYWLQKEEALPTISEEKESKQYHGKTKQYEHAKQAANILFSPCKSMDPQHRYEYVIAILDKLSHHIPVKSLQRIKIGEGLQCLEQIQQTVNKLGSQRSYEVQLQKQVIGAALIRIDANTAKPSRKRQKAYSRQRRNGDTVDIIQPRSTSHSQRIQYDINASNMNVVRRIFGASSGEIFYDHIQ